MLPTITEAAMASVVTMKRGTNLRIVLIENGSGGGL